MKVDGDGAAGYKAVRTDSFIDVNHGILLSADDQIGHVVWKDKVGEQKEVTLGPHSIRIVMANIR